jgi:hypothetical protein
MPRTFVGCRDNTERRRGKRKLHFSLWKEVETDQGKLHVPLPRLCLGIQVALGREVIWFEYDLSPSKFTWRLNFSQQR